MTASTARTWLAALEVLGLTHRRLGDDGRLTSTADGRRRLFTLTAARWPLEVEPVAVPWPERVLAAEIRGLLLVNVHSPISSRPGLVKLLTHEGVHEHLAAREGPAVVCGDLNTPRREHPDGTVWTFARTSRGKLRPERGERWDQAELALIKGLEPHGFRDAFRSLHGLEVRELSWEWQRTGGGWRLDHLIASEQVHVASIAYRHEWRQDGLSDHSALVAELSWPVPGDVQPIGVPSSTSVPNGSRT